MSFKTDIQVTEMKDIKEHGLSYQYIMETLSIYKTQHIYLDSARWNGSELIGWFRLEHYPFTKEEHIDYVTASMLMLYLSQLGYIYGRILCEKNLLPSGINITIHKFFRLRDEGNIVFVGLDNIRFRKRIPISKSLLKIKMILKCLYVINGNLIGDISFEVGDGIFTGDTKVAIVLNPQEED
jgi:hypothetical protein